MHRYRVLALVVEQPSPGSFQWVLLQSFDDVDGYAPFERSPVRYASASEAFEAGNRLLMQLIADGNSGWTDGAGGPWP